MSASLRYDYKMAREYNWTVKNIAAANGFDQENYFIVGLFLPFLSMGCLSGF